jgi:tetratricopeptide (TPR) repeat protein
MSRLIAMLAAFGLALAPAAARAAGSCKFQLAASVPVTMRGLQPTIATKVNGHDAAFILDTGAFYSSVVEDAAEPLGMKRTTVPGDLMLKTVGGSEHAARVVEAQDFEFAGIKLHKQQFVVVGRIGGGAVGLFGQNLLSSFDMEYDLANGVVRYFKATNCGDANLAYWSAGKPFSRVALVNPGVYLLRVQANAKVNGHGIKVTFDTGSPVSFISRRAAGWAGVTGDTEGASAEGVVHGVYGGGQETFLAPFASFAIGDEEIRNTQLRVARIDLDDTEMLLGADFFLSHRVLVSKSQNRIYFTYNGGPVFRLDRNPGAQVADAAAAEAKAASPDGGPKTAADYLRRGQAAAARHDYASALGDFGKAIELEPTNAQAYQGRAHARLAAGQPVLAMADLDQALKLQPDNVDALVGRGELYLAAHDPVRADADFQAAMKHAPDNAMLPAHIGYVYARAGLFERALAELDRWIAAHPKDESAPQVLGVRCWTRAAWGRQLDLALADCDAAMRRDRVSSVMEARGLALLRMGRTDDALAQYGQAVRAQPRSPDALYGRGLAELAKGDKTAAEADFKAAAAQRPGVVQDYQHIGLGPPAPAPTASVSDGKS